LSLSPASEVGQAHPNAAEDEAFRKLEFRLL
jgi:hypothetical protein